MIRIPRKKKKYYHYNPQWFPYTPKVRRYFCYLNIVYSMKVYGMSAEELCNTFGRYTMDDVIWWAWVRWKELGIKPELSPKYQEYWDWFVSQGVINEEKLCKQQP